MTYGKLNLLGMIAVPVAAAVSALIVFGFDTDALAYIFAMNCIAVLIAGLFSGLMLRKANTPLACFVAVSPTLLPSVLVSLIYLWRAVSPAAIAPGAEYIALPQYHILAVLLLGVLAFILGFFVRSR